MDRRIVQIGEFADSLPHASAEEAEKPTPDDYSATDWGPVVSALVRSESGPNPEPDCRSNQNVAGAAMMHPWRLVARGISALWKRRSNPPLAELSEGFAIDKVT